MAESVAKVWQLPYVNVFKHCKIEEWKRAAKEGDVTTKMDKTLRCTVYKIAGSVPASNYLLLPRTPSQSLGLTGRFMYLQFKPTAGKYFVFHLEVATKDDLIVRISISNLFKDFKSTSTWLQFPFLCADHKHSVASVTGKSVKGHDSSQIHRPAPAHTMWTLLAVDFQHILSQYLNRNFSYLKTIKLCANMSVRNIFTSDTDYNPQLSFKDAQRAVCHLKGSPIPREMSFPVIRDKQWDELYSHVKFPSNTPFDSNNHETVAQPRDSHKKNTSLNKIQAQVAKRIGGGDAITTLPPPLITEELPEKNIVSDSGVHIYAQPESEIAKSVHKENDYRSLLAGFQKVSLDDAEKTRLVPDPIIKLRNVVGIRGADNAPVVWTSDKKSLIYCCHSIVISLNIDTCEQKFFIGHTDKVSCLDVNEKLDLVASGQAGDYPIVRIWKQASASLVTVFKASAALLTSLYFSLDGEHLNSVGRDIYGKSVIAIWNTSDMLRSSEVCLIAKAHADVDVAQLKVAAFDKSRMISCGKENIRFWRLKQKSLRSCPVTLGEYSTHEFTDLAFGISFGSSGEAEQPKFVYCCSSSGFVFEIDYAAVALRVVRKLVKSNDNSNLVALTSLSVTKDYCVTGSYDGFMRVWPLDFSTVLLEAEHETAVVSVGANSDGSQIFSVTSANQLGILDIRTRCYRSLMNSHSDYIVSTTLSPDESFFVTASKDSRINVWNTQDLSLQYDFHSPSEQPTLVACHPKEKWFVCGFETGAVRLFDLSSAACVQEYDVLKGSITGLVVLPDGKQLISSCSLGFLSSFSAEAPFKVLRVLNCMLPRGVRKKPALALSKDGSKCVFVGPSEYVVCVIDSRTLDELVRVDITQLNPEGLHRGVIEKASIISVSAHHILLVTNTMNLYMLELSSGRLLSSYSQIHKESCTSIAVSPSSDLLLTAGDNLLKVWDYRMRFDINHQSFLGHSEPISQVLYLKKTNCVITVGDMICVWNVMDNDKIFESSKPSFKSQQDTRLMPEDPRLCVPQPTLLDVSAIHAQAVSDEEDLDQVIELPDNEFTTGDNEAAVVPSEYHRIPPVMIDECEIERNEMLLEPTCLSHFKSRVVESCISRSHYAPPDKQAGLSLKSIIGYNGNGRGNVIWKPEKGLLFYSCGTLVICEDLASNSQKHFLGHVSEVSTLAIQECGDLLASASGPNETAGSQVIIWDADSLSCKKILSYHYRNIISLKFSPDDRFLLSLGDYRERAFCIWSCESLGIVAASRLEFVPNAVAWDPFSVGEFCVVGNDCSVTFWMLEENEDSECSLSVDNSDCPHDVKAFRVNGKRDHSFTAISYAGLSIVYIASDNGLVSGWDTRSNQCYMHWSASNTEISYLTSMGSKIITASVDKCVKLWTVLGTAEGQRVSDLPGNGLVMEDELTLSEAAVGGSFDDSLELGIIGTKDCLLWYINWTERNSIKLTSGHQIDINCVTFCDTEFIATGSQDGGIRVFSVTDNEQSIHFKTSAPVCSLSFAMRLAGCKSKQLLAGFQDGTIRFLDLDKAEVRLKISPHNEAVTRTAISTDSEFIISGSKSGLVALIQPKSGTILRMISDHKGKPITDVSFSAFVHHENILFAIASVDRRISIWQSNLAKDRCVLSDWITFAGLDESSLPTLAKFSPTEKDVVLFTGATREKDIKFYNLRQRKVMRKISLTEYLNDLQVSPLGGLIVGSTIDWLVKLIDYREGSFQDFLAHSGSVRNAVFSPNGALISSIANNEVHIWRVSL